jgi:hypothetical protein
VADKGKGKNIIIGDPRTSNISEEEIARKASDKKTNKSGGAGGQTQLRSRARQPDPSIANGSHLHADGPVLRQTVRQTQPDSLPMARGISLYTKLGKKREGKAHMVDRSRSALLLISCSLNMLARRSFYMIDQQRNLRLRALRGG